MGCVVACAVPQRQQASSVSFKKQAEMNLVENMHGLFGESLKCNCMNIRLLGQDLVSFAILAVMA
jgi:hypothetical protein